MRITFIYPCIGRVKNKKYVKSWVMEPLAIGVLNSLTPSDIETKFYDDRIEAIPYNEATDLAAISIETYTAKRCYQIAEQFRKRNVPVVIGGFHATLMPDEVSEHADAVVIGEAENVWGNLITDLRTKNLQKFYQADARPSLINIRPDRSLFRGKNYLKLGLIEASRGCRNRCDFCAIQSFYKSTQNYRPHQEVAAEIKAIKDKYKLFFFVDDNITANTEEAKKLLKSLVPLKIKWVGQGSLTCIEDKEFMELLRASGCQGLLVGFESLNEKNLTSMKKHFNLKYGSIEEAIKQLHHYGIRLYGTFLFGYDHDQTDDLTKTVRFAINNRLFIAAFNHLVPFPGTPLYERIENEGRLISD